MNQVIYGLKRITIEMDRLPPNLNMFQRHTVRCGRAIRYTTKEGKEFKKNIRTMVKDDFDPLEGKLWVTIHLTVPTRRKCDIDNYFKCLLDSLNGIAYYDDSQIVELDAKKKYVKGVAKTVISVQEME